MTAPLGQSKPIVVPVALDARAYDIVIGRGLLASLGERIKNLRPGARGAIVTDETVCGPLFQGHGRSAQGCRHRVNACSSSSGRGFEELRKVQIRLRGLARFTR